jgi:hypothetical protein
VQQGAQVVDLAGMVNIMSDYDANEDTGWQVLAPVGEAVTIELGVVRQGANGGQPALVTFFEPCEELLMRSGAPAIFWNQGRLVAAQGSLAEGIILVHPLGPGDVLEDIGDGTTGARRQRVPILLPDIAQVGN